MTNVGIYQAFDVIFGFGALAAVLAILGLSHMGKRKAVFILGASSSIVAIIAICTMLEFAHRVYVASSNI